MGIHIPQDRLVLLELLIAVLKILASAAEVDTQQYEPNRKASPRPWRLLVPLACSQYVTLPVVPFAIFKVFSWLPKVQLCLRWEKKELESGGEMTLNFDSHVKALH